MNKKVYVVYFGGNTFQSPFVFGTEEEAVDFMETCIKEEEKKGEYHVRYKDVDKDSIHYNLENTNGGMIRVAMDVEEVL